MNRKIFRELVSVEEAKKTVESLKFEIKEECVNIIDACGRVSAEDVYSPIDIPSFNRATMDGYALRAEDTFGADEENPIHLKVVGKIEAGEERIFEVRKGEAVEISTGAAIPKGSNAVVMVEQTHREGEEVFVYKPVAPRENVIASGSDIMAGELILRKGSRITTRDVAVLSAVGIGNVKVLKRPAIAVISTGNELVEVGGKLSYGKIYDTNSAALCAAIRENGGEAIFLGVAKDNYDEIRGKVLEALKISDIVIISGGTSAGVEDLVHSVLNKEGRVLVHGIAARPGKPTIIAEVYGKPVFGLPGYPVSAMMIFEVFVADLIRKAAGLGEKRREKIKAKVGHRTFSSIGRREFLPVNIVGESIYPVTGYYSAAISKLAEADGFIEIGEEQVFLEEGEDVEVKLFSTLKPADLVIIGSHCVGIDVLLELMRKKRPWVVKVINVGSSGGLVAIRRGETDIAGTHLLDEETGEYNIPFIRKFGLKDVLLVKGYAREQGLILRKGNPKRIRGVEDLIGGVAIINRNAGSGTRVLFDMYLREISKKGGVKFEELVKRIEGYSIEAKTHTAVAVAVLMGKADAGIGIRTVADRYGLDFIPLRNEEYDFVIRKDATSKEAVREFIQTLKSEDFRKELERRLPGLRITEKTGFIIEF